ncbi:MAG: alanine--tRNA ligase [Candidatus Gracilibacteria bacterium]|nr:alanine--tRNA ligase [Candidatus Gracilibacteria bacterium]
MEYNSKDIRQKYLDFFKSKGHAIIPSAPVVPENDPTVLFNTAGMQPLVPYLLGETHPLGKRLADSQKCIRTGDIEEVGDNSHLTFFEMLGNWSLGDYFKKDSIAYSWEFLTSKDWLALDPRKIAVTVFEGDSDAPRDEESASIWASVGMPKTRISYLPKKDNWWAAGDTGPCGPDTEIFYWVGKSEFPPEGSNVGNDEKNWMEIWNNVFMEYNKLPDGTLVNLPAQNVDTGMGLERITATLNGEKTVYNTDIFREIISSISNEIGVEYNDETMKSIRIIADHSRTATVMISDGVVPSNVDQGYVLRRLIRIAIRQAYKLGFKGEFLSKISSTVVDKLGVAYPHMIEKRAEIAYEILREEKQFGETLEKGLKEFDKLVNGFKIAFERTGQVVNTISGEKAFKLYDTFGFPLEMTQELALEVGLTVDEVGFKEAEKKHQALSRAGAEQKFKGGLADSGEETVSLHSATHLLLAGLRKYLGENVHQKGSNITSERLRFDFSNDEKVEKEILDKVEAYVNDAIQNGFETILTNMDKEEARANGVEGSFWEKYPEIVKVYSMVGADGTVYSKELCGGPHVENSKTMGKFKIQKEEASSRGVRRIKAVLIKD